MNKHLITFLFLLLAIALYFTGMALPATIFLVLGMVAEMVFWVRLFRRRDHHYDNERRWFSQ